MRTTTLNHFHADRTDHWTTPHDAYKHLDAEFRFTHDPCPLYGDWGLLEGWGTRCFVNPPYSEIPVWIDKARLEIEASRTDVAVFLIPSRTGSQWFHDAMRQGAEVRFIRGRLKFGGASTSAPFDSLLLIFRREGKVMTTECRICHDDAMVLKSANVQVPLCSRCYQQERRKLAPTTPKRWAMKFDACVKCGTTEHKHDGHGVCRKCNKGDGPMPTAPEWARYTDYEPDRSTCADVFKARLRESRGS